MAFPTRDLSLRQVCTTYAKTSNSMNDLRGVIYYNASGVAGTVPSGTTEFALLSTFGGTYPYNPTPRRTQITTSGVQLPPVQSPINPVPLRFFIELTGGGGGSGGNGADFTNIFTGGTINTGGAGGGGGGGAFISGTFNYDPAKQITVVVSEGGLGGQGGSGMGGNGTAASMTYDGSTLVALPGRGGVGGVSASLSAAGEGGDGGQGGADNPGGTAGSNGSKSDQYNPGPGGAAGVGGSGGVGGTAPRGGTPGERGHEGTPGDAFITWIYI